MSRDSGSLGSIAVPQLLEHTPAALVAVTAEQRILCANRRACALFGYQPGELRDRVFEELLAPSARPSLAALWQAYLADLAPPEDVRLRGLHRDRGELDLCLALDHVHIDGGPVLLASFQLDTGPRDAELAALRERLEHLESIVQHIPIALYAGDDPDRSRVTFMSDGVRDLLGYEPSELLRDAAFWLDRIHPDDRRRVIAARAVASENSRYDFEYRCRHRDGAYRWIQATVRLLQDDRGSPRRFVGCWTDVTDRKRAEEQHRAAEARSQALLNAIPDAMARMNSLGEYLDIKAPREPSLLPPPPAVGSRLEDQNRSPALVEQVMGAIRRVIETGEDETIEYELPLAEGTLYREARLSKSGPDEVVAIIRDLTERIRSEVRIKELNQHLEQRNHELEATIQELESFSYSVSHDLRAPLRAIDGFSQVLAEDYAGQLDDAGQRLFGRIRAASQRMGQIIDDLLSLARIKRSYLQREQIDLSALAAEVAEGLRAVFPAHPVALDIAPGMTVVADRSLMRILLESLLGNAWKYTSRRERARVEVGTLAQDGEQVYFVRDNGAGFDMKYAHKLFGPFQRLHAMDAFPGTGIGLATAAQIVSLHGGRIWAEGAVDQGATFSFTLAP